MIEGRDAMVSPKGPGKPRRALVLEVFAKSCRVKFYDDGSTTRATARKVKIIGRPPTPPITPPPVLATVTFKVAGAERIACLRPAAPPLRPLPKPAPPARSEAFKAFVRHRPCINCTKQGFPQVYPTEADHEGERGVGQKTSDFFTIPLCLTCHRCITDTYCLPDLLGSKLAGKQVLMSRGWTEELVVRTQVEILSEALARLPTSIRRIAIETALRGVDSAVLNGVLR